MAGRLGALPGRLPARQRVHAPPSGPEGVSMYRLCMLTLVEPTPPERQGQISLKHCRSDRIGKSGRRLRV